jgi:hypothetical protein
MLTVPNIYSIIGREINRKGETEVTVKIDGDRGTFADTFQNLFAAQHWAADILVAYWDYTARQAAQWVVANTAEEEYCHPHDLFSCPFAH